MPNWAWLSIIHQNRNLYQQRRLRYNPPMQLVLASSSPFRAALLSRLGLAFIQQSPGTDESAHPGETPDTYVVRLAQEKAASCAGPGRLLIGADQVAVLDGQLLGKPTTRAIAEQQLQQLSGHEVSFLTGLCLLNPQGQSRSTCIPVQVRYRELSARQIRSYLDREDALHCSAALRSEGLGIALLQHSHSDDPTALIGLPLITLCTWLIEAGLDPLQP